MFLAVHPRLNDVFNLMQYPHHLELVSGFNCKNQWIIVYCAVVAIYGMPLIKEY